MITTLQFKAEQAAGVLGGIAIVMVKKGYRIKQQSLKKALNEGYCLIQMTLESHAPITQRDLAETKSIVPEILDISYLSQLDSSTQTVATAETVDEELLRGHFRRITAAYPDIAHVLKEIDTDLDSSRRKLLLGKLGKACGRKDYKSRYALGGLLNLDKTLQRILLPSLKELFEVEMEAHSFKVSDCPLCFGRQVIEPDCVFITQYIQGFLDSVPNIPVVSVGQSHCRSMNHSHCVFFIHSAAD